MTVTSTPDRLYAAGFPIGPTPDEPCGSCGHRWGNHLLNAAGDDPLDGGWAECPHVDCRCAVTWGVPDSAAEAIRQYREQKGQQ